MQCAAFMFIFRGKNARASTPLTDFTSSHLIYSCQLKCLDYTQLTSFFFWQSLFCFSNCSNIDITFLKNGNFTLPRVSIRFSLMGLPIFYYFGLQNSNFILFSFIGVSLSNSTIAMWYFWCILFVGIGWIIEEVVLRLSDKHLKKS